MGNQQSQFEALIIPHAPALLRFARRLSGSATVAEDLVQDALLRAWRSVDTVRNHANPKAWVFRILLNTWYSEGRRRSARPVEAPLAEAARVGQASPGDTSEMMQALGRLPEEQRSVLLLTVVEGFTGQEVAGMLDIPAGTVMSRVSRARAAMRASLSEEAAGEQKKAGVGLP